MEEFDFDDSLPPFANDEVRAEHAKFVVSHHNLIASQQKIAELQLRIRHMELHAKNVAEQVLSSQSYVQHQNRNIELAEHEEALRCRQLSMLQNEVRLSQKQTADIEDATYSIQEQLRSMEHRRGILRERIRIQEEEIGKMSKVSDTKLADEEALQEFMKVDSKRVTELRGMLASAITRRSQLVSNLEEETSAHQATRTELKNVLSQLQQTKEGKAVDLTQLEDLMKSISQKDEELQRVATEYSAVIARSSAKEREVENLKVNLQAAETSNAKKRVQIEAGQRRVAQLAIEAQQMELKVAVANAQLAESHQELIQTQGRDRQRLESVLDHAMAEIEVGVTELEKAEQNLAAEKLKLKQLEGGQITREMQVNEARISLEQSAESVALLETELKRTKDSLFVANLRLGQSQEEAKILNSELEVLMATQLPLEIEKLEIEKTSLNESIFALDYEYQALDRKLELMSGNVKLDGVEKAKLTSRLAELEIRSGESKSVLSGLTNLVNKRKVELNTQQREFALIQSQLNMVTDKLVDVEAENESIGRLEFALAEEKGEALVARDANMADLNEGKENLRIRIENFRMQSQQLELAEGELAKRMTESNVHAARLRAVAKELETHRHLLAVKLGQSKQKNAVLQLERDTLIRARQGSGADDAHSQAYQVVQAAQEREELVATENRLVAAIARTANELAALEDAEKHMSKTNTAYVERQKAEPLETDLMELEAQRDDLARQFDTINESLSAQLMNELPEPATQDLSARILAIESVGLVEFKNSINKLADMCPDLFNTIRQNLLLKGIDL